MAPPLLRKLIHLEKKALLDESDKLKVQEIKTAINNLPRPTKNFKMDEMIIVRETDQVVRSDKDEVKVK